VEAEQGWRTPFPGGAGFKPARFPTTGFTPETQITMVVLDPELGLVVDVVACEDGHTQECAWFAEVLPKVESGDLQQLAKNIDLAKFQKHPRGPKKPRPMRTRGARIKHVATARIIAKR
jgi:hypothetical protein